MRLTHRIARRTGLSPEVLKPRLDAMAGQAVVFARAATGIGSRTPPSNSTLGVPPFMRATPGTRFIAGEPMNPATNVLTGAS